MSASEDAAKASGGGYPPARDRRLTAWVMARAASVVIFTLLVPALLLWPANALSMVWNLLVPLLPASFLIAPQLWRGLCPLATLNQWSSGRFRCRRLRGRPLDVAHALGILLLALLVPARRFLLNEHGAALAAALVVVALAAMILGAFFQGRAGFCNAVCPILPVERLYGQHPFWTLHNRRCDRCNLCIPKGCLDVDPAKSLLQAIGTERGLHRWLTTSYGVFAAAFPGFIIGYYTTSDQPISAATAIYLRIALCSAGSYLGTWILVHILRLDAPTSLAALAAVAIALYYWWAVPLMAEFLGSWPAGVPAGRAAASALAAAWLARAISPRRTSESTA